MNFFKIVPYIIFSYVFMFTNDGFSQCDTLPPICIAPADVQISFDSFEFYFTYSPFLDSINFGSMKIVNRFGAAESVDNCTANIIELSPEYSSFDICSEESVYRRFLAIDENGNQSKDTCKQLITTNPLKNVDKFIQLPSLYKPFQSFIPSDSYTRFGNGQFLLIEEDFSEVPRNDTIQDYWLFNWCSSIFDPERFYFLPVFDIDGDGRKGDAYTIRITNDSLYFERPNLRDSVIAFPHNSWRYTLNQVYDFSGNVFTDLNNNCEQELGENAIPNFNIIVRSFPSGAIYQTSTDSQTRFLK